MKLKAALSVALFLACHWASAQVIKIDDTLNSSQSAWEIPLEKGSLTLVNGTKSNLLIHVQINQGVIGLISKDNAISNCLVDLSAESHAEIGLCELEPNGALEFDLDFVWASSHYPKPASGFYTVQRS
ncbi:hypothetical protein Lrub_2320 [Legionella rubrilucens]|uniref:Uncharacterized protein n=1 Tax=Legionella rubrilucens TaxID=458 RepID=A0A0W0XM20_9GAMM|nr:hypothetical protein [Legionella rubrilucens]KTD45523.1 hypothetical protein Lrub_2320 [Legionella rubrilucens]